MTRLERLRRMREMLEDNYPDTSAAELFVIALPGWRIVDYTARLHRSTYRVAGPGDDETMAITNPLTSVDGAIWLARQALPENLWPPTLVPEGVHSALCEFEEMPSGRAFRSAGTLPIAICRAVVAALIAIEERAEPRLQQIGQEFDRETANRAKAGWSKP